LTAVPRGVHLGAMQVDDTAANSPGEAASPAHGSARDAELQAAVFALIDRRGPGKTIDPAEVARAVGGVHPHEWGPLMRPLQRVVVALAREGRIAIFRKSKVIDPADLRGIYRIGRPPAVE
jgi:hypothetical protein